MHKILIILACLSLLIFQGGCWDLQEIEEVGFVIGVGFDSAQDEEQQKSKVQQVSEDQHEQFFRASYQVAIPSLVRSVNEGGGMEKAYFMISTTGMTNMKMRREASSKRSRHLKFEHLKVIIIHHELARQGMLNHLLDFYIRDHEMRRKTNLYISTVDTQEILDQDFHLEYIESEAIIKTHENYPRVSSMLRPTNIGDISKDIIGDNSYLIPRITNKKDDIILNGAAVFMGKTNKMIGWLNVKETESYNWIKGEYYDSIIEVLFEGHQFVFESIDQDAEITYVRNDDENHFHVHIKVEGNFVENWMHKVKINDTDTIEKLERAIEKQITKQCHQLIEKLQHEYYTDILGFHKKVKRKENAYWKAEKENWDGENGLFSKAKIEITTEAQIRHYMLQELLEEET